MSVPISGTTPVKKLEPLLKDKLPIIKEIHRITSSLAGLFRSTLSVLSKKIIIPEGISKAAKSTKLLAGPGLVFSSASLVQDTVEMVTQKKPVLEKIRDVANTVVSAGSVISGVTGFTEGLSAVGAIAAQPWTGVVDKVLFPVSMLGLGLNAWTFGEYAHFYREFSKHVHMIDQKQTEEKRVTELTEMCRYLRTDVASIQKKLGLDNTGKFREERIEKIMKNITNENAQLKQKALEKGEQLMADLKKRANLKLGVEITSLSLRVASTTNLGLSLFVPVLAPVTLVAGLVFGAMNFAWSFISKAMLPSNPWQTKPLHERVFTWMSNRAHEVVNCAKRIGTEIQSKFQQVQTALSSKMPSFKFMQMTKVTA